MPTVCEYESVKHYVGAHVEHLFSPYDPAARSRARGGRGGGGVIGTVCVYTHMCAPALYACQTLVCLRLCSSTMITIVL